MAVSALLRSRKTRRDMMWGVLFITPWIIGFLCFTFYPTLMSLYYGFTKFSIVKTPEWIGLDNYVRLLTNDRLFLKTMGNTLYMVLIQVPLGIIISFITALILNMEVRGRAIYRTIYFLPTIVPPVAATLLWLWILNPQHGILNAGLEMIGMRSPSWFSDPKWSKPALILMALWGTGGSTVMYLAALQGVPKELYEAAMLDGASWLQRTLRITIPLVSPVTLFMAITGIIGTFQIFTTVYIVGGTGSGSTSGSPQGSLLFYGLYLYANAFTYFKMGYAAAMAWILFLIILVITIIMIKTSAYWTHYEVA
jgi:multiple sugar transport system permease protein